MSDTLQYLIIWYLPGPLFTRLKEFYCTMNQRCRVGACGLDLSVSGQGSVVGFCKHSNLRTVLQNVEDL